MNKPSDTMQEIRLVFLGFGSVNSALVEMLLDKSETHRHRRCLRVQQNEGVRLIPWRIVAIVTGRHGSVCVPAVDNLEGCAGTWYEVDARMALEQIKSNGVIDKYLVVDQTGTKNKTTSQVGEKDSSSTNRMTHQTIQMLRNLAHTKTANIVVEAIPSNPRGGGEPALSFIRSSLEAGLHVVSANKGPLAQQQNGPAGIEEIYWKLQQVASANKVHYFHESSVMDGVPIFSFWETMPNATLLKLRGCLNSTSTTILSRMEGSAGETFEQALAEAKKMGIVETDESLDIDGYDSAVKLRAMLVVLSTPQYSSGKHILVPSIDDIPRDTLRSITKEEIQRTYNDNKTKYRLVATAELIDALDQTQTKEWKAKVELEQILPSDPIYNLRGSSSSVQFYTDVLGPITLISTNPTLVDTAYGLFSDIVRVVNSEAF